MTFAKQYLESRLKLAGVVGGILELARVLKAKNTDFTVADWRLSAPLRVVICGDKGTGKTTLIRALFGLDKNSAKRLDHGFIEYSDENLVIVESPATSQLQEDSRIVMQEALAEADYILWALPVGNPWAAPTWDLVSDQKDETLEISSILLLQEDLRTSDELEVLKGHIRDLCFQRARRPLEILTVSSNRDKNPGLQQCSQIVDRALNESKWRRGLLREVYQEVYILMMDLEENMDQRARTLESDKGYLQSIEAEIERDKGVKIKEYSTDFAKWGGLYESSLLPILKLVRHKTGVIGITKSLFSRGDDAIQIERALLDLIEEKSGQQGVVDGKRLLDSCKKRWEGMRPHLEERLAVEIGELEEAAFLDQVDHLADRLSKRARHTIMKLRMRRVLDQLLMENRRKQKYVLCVFFLLVSLAGLLGVFRVGPHPWLATSVLVGAFVVLCSYYAMVLSAKKTIVEAYAGGLIDLRAAFSESVLVEYNEGIHEFYKGYLPMFENMKRYIADARASLIPRQKQWNDLFLELKASEQDL